MIIAKGATAIAGFEKTSGAAERSSHSAGVRQVPGNDNIWHHLINRQSMWAGAAPILRIEVGIALLSPSFPNCLFWSLAILTKWPSLQIRMLWRRWLISWRKAKGWEFFFVKSFSYQNTPCLIVFFLRLGKMHFYWGNWRPRSGGDFIIFSDPNSIISYVMLMRLD